MQDADPQEEARALAMRLSETGRLGGDVLAAAVLSLALSGIAGDSRSAAKQLETAHALILRAVTMLAADPPMIAITRRDARTQRVFYNPTDLAISLMPVKAA